VARGLNTHVLHRSQRLRRHRGRNAEARDLLALIYGWFTEGFGTLDLKEAKILLDALEP
jgi:predicted ATPase